MLSTISESVVITELVAFEIEPNSSFLWSYLSTLTKRPSARAPREPLTAAIGWVKLHAIRIEIMTAAILRTTPITTTIRAACLAVFIISGSCLETVTT